MLKEVFNMAENFSDQELVRRQKMEELRAKGIDPFGKAYHRTHRSRQLRELFGDKTKEELEEINQHASIAGRIIGDAMERLCDHIAMVHLKDFVPENGDLKSIAAGTGEMDYREILRFLKARKPYIQATLENTSNENAVSSREFIQHLYEEV